MGRAESPGGTDSGADLFDRWLAHHAQTRSGDESRADDAPAPVAPADPVEPPSEAHEVPNAEEPAKPEPEPDREPGHEPGREPGSGADPRPDPAPAPRGRRRASRRRAVPSTPDAERAAVLAALRPEADPRRQPRASTSPVPDDHGIPQRLEFTPRRGAHRLLGLALLVSLAACLAAGYQAWSSRTPTMIATTVSLAALTAFVYAVRAGSSPTRIILVDGRLEIHRGGARHLFDLTHHGLPVEEVGRPGDRRWRVDFVRRGRDPFVVDASMVDPHEFSRVLEHYRPRRS